MSENLNCVFEFSIASLEFESVEEAQKLYTDTGIAALMESGKIWDFEWSLNTDWVLG